MFITLLVVTLVLSFAVSAIVVKAFAAPIDSILKRIIADAISTAWLKYLKFAILVVGVSAGVRIYELEKYITPQRWVKNSTINPDFPLGIHGGWFTANLTGKSDCLA